MIKNSTFKKTLSLAIALLMVLGMIPLSSFVSVAATSRVYSTGEWVLTPTQLNSNHDGFSNNGPYYTSMGIADTNFYFMQTQDNQEFFFTTNLLAKKNQVTNGFIINSVETDFGHDTAFYALVTNESWQKISGTLAQDGGDASPNGDELGRDGLFSTSTNKWAYTCTFTANGSAVYHPEWNIDFKTKGSLDSYVGYNTAYLVLEGTDEAVNVDPVFTVQVIDIRELRHLVDMANDAGVNVDDIINGRDLSGSTYYDQATVDTMVAALRARLLCDYTALDTQIARANALDENVNGPLGGHLYDDDAYAVFESAYNAAIAVDRYLTDDGLAPAGNQGTIDSAAAVLQSAIDNLVPTKKAIVKYYANDTLFAINTVELNKGYNFHDVTDKYIGTPTQERMVFEYWADVNGNEVMENTPITGDMEVYASFEVAMEGIAPISSSGKWEHKLSPNDSDGRGDNYISMWVKDINFNFMQIVDNETFSFYTDLTAYKNDGMNYVSVDSVYLLNNDAETDAFIAAMGSHDIDYYCVTKNSDDKPTNSQLPGVLGSGYSWQSTIYRVIWRYIYTFNGNGHATYTPKWNIVYTAGGWELSAGQHDLPNGGDSYVQFTINVTDARELIGSIDKAESILNNPNNTLTESEKTDLRAVLDDINANFTLDGSVYYDQATIDAQTARIKAYIPDSLVVPCDYSQLDAAIAAANAYDRDHGNDNNHYIDEVWTNFLNAYNAAVSCDRTLTVDDHNVNQPMIDRLTRNLLFALEELTYNTHVNQKADDSDLNDLVDDALNDIGTDNSNGKYDDDAWQDYIDALNDAQDVINQDLYDDPSGNNQQTIDDALQALQDAIDALSDPTNQNDPCDYSVIDALIAQAQAIDNNDGFITTASYDALQDALTDALAVDRNLYDNGTNQAIIDQAAQDLQDAINGLVPDKTALQTLVNTANGTDTTGYTGATILALNDAIDDAQYVLDDPNATLQDVRDAFAALENALNALTPDKTGLEDAITAGESVDQSAIDGALAQDLQDAIDAGDAVDQDPAATVQQIKDATDDIIDALNAILQDVVTDAQATDTTGYTAQSIQDLQDAISDAQTVLADSDATATELADAINDVLNNLDNLDVDKDALEEAINAGTNAVTDGLPQNLIDALDTALTNGTNVDHDGNATVQEVQDATEAIRDALEDILTQLVDDAQNTDTTGMTPGSVQDLEDMIDAAELVLADPDSTAEEIANAINDLQDAVNTLAPDKTDLEDAILAGESIDTSAITPTSLADALADALTDGHTVDNDNDATVQEIADATQAIKDALEDILQQVVTDAENTDTTGMTPSSVSNLEDFIDAANDILADPNATPQEIAGAINDILDAIDDLTPDKTELEEAITAAEGIDTTGVDPTLADALQNAIDDGNAVDQDPDATVQEIQNAIDAIEDALKDILQDVVDDAENTDTTGFSDETIQDLQDAIDDANAVLNDPNATADEIADAIKDIKDAIDALSTDITITVLDDSDNVIQTITVPVSTTMGDVADLLDLVSTTDGDKILAGYIDDNTGNYIPDDEVLTGSQTIVPVYELDHLVPTNVSSVNIDRNGTDKYINGIDTSNNTLEGFKAEFVNDEVCIEAVDINGNDLAGLDRVGTGSVITYRSKLTGQVYETLIVIIYGDVDGDGIIGADDLTKMKAVTYATDTVSDNAYLRMASDVDGDGAFDGIDCSYISCTMHGIECIEQAKTIIRN